MNIPCIAVVDTNGDPDAVPIPIPGNDDAIRAVGLFCSIIADAAIDGRGAYEKKRQEEDDKKKAAFSEATGHGSRPEKRGPETRSRGSKSGSLT